MKYKIALTPIAPPMGKRINTIDERAYKARNSHIIRANTEFAQGEASGFVKGYCVCANEQKAIDIEKAIGWIKGHIDAVTWHGGKEDEDFIDAFRRALE